MFFFKVCKDKQEFMDFNVVLMYGNLVFRSGSRLYTHDKCPLGSVGCISTLLHVRPFEIGTVNWMHIKGKVELTEH